MASFPKFLLGDNTDYPDAIFIIHTEFPRFILNLANDEVEWNSTKRTKRNSPPLLKASLRKLRLSMIER